MHRFLYHPNLLRRALVHALQDDALNIAQSAAYSSIVALFPALIVVAAIVPLLPDTAPIRSDLAAVVQRIVPADVIPLLESYFTTSKEGFTSTRALILGVLVSVLGSSGVIATFMEGLRRAYGLPPDCWSFLSRRGRALMLVPLSLLPLGISSLLVLFGHFIELRLSTHGTPAQMTSIYLLAAAVRWLFAVISSAGLIAILYKLGTPLHLSWRATLPGALLATTLWFASTVVFGWYVTRFANYSRVYGSLGAGIALLFWLYLAALSILIGAEYNAELRTIRRSPGSAAAPSVLSPAP